MKARYRQKLLRHRKLVEVSPSGEPESNSEIAVPESTVNRSPGQWDCGEFLLLKRVQYCQLAIQVDEIDEDRRPQSYRERSLIS
jgi:hypothetical protein